MWPSSTIPKDVPRRTPSQHISEMLLMSVTTLAVMSGVWGQSSCPSGDTWGSLTFHAGTSWCPVPPPQAYSPDYSKAVVQQHSSLLGKWFQQSREMQLSCHIAV